MTSIDKKSKKGSICQNVERIQNGRFHLVIPPLK